MAESIRDLKALLDAKGGTGTFTDDELQELIDYINGMISIRTVNQIPADNGTNISGTDCLSFSGATLPNIEPFSVSDFDDFQTDTDGGGLKYVPPLTCSAQTYTASWCTSRTADLIVNCTSYCTCNDRTTDVITQCPSGYCTCNNRTTDLNCGTNYCYCNNRTTDLNCASNYCRCNTDDVPQANTCTNYQGCACKARFITCQCRNRQWLCSGYCYCNNRTTDRLCPSGHCYCNDRTTDLTCDLHNYCSCDNRTTDLTCTDHDYCSCESRTVCSCDVRCQCNVVDVYS